MRDFNFDRLTTINPVQAGQSAMRVITALQQQTPEQQIAGLAIAFSLILDKYRANAANVLQVGKSILERASSQHPELRAVRDYAVFEL